MLPAANQPPASVGSEGDRADSIAVPAGEHGTAAYLKCSVSELWTFAGKRRDTPQKRGPFLGVERFSDPALSHGIFVTLYDRELCVLEILVWQEKIASSVNRCCIRICFERIVAQKMPSSVTPDSVRDWRQDGIFGPFPVAMCANGRRSRTKVGPSGLDEVLRRGMGERARSAVEANRPIFQWNRKEVLPFVSDTSNPQVFP